jgi:hypothetical protein
MLCRNVILLVLLLLGACSNSEIRFDPELARKLHEEHEAAIRSANPRWDEYHAAAEAARFAAYGSAVHRTKTAEAASLAADFDFAPFMASELENIKLVLKSGNAPSAAISRIDDALVGCKYPGWGPFIIAYRAGDWAAAATLAHRIHDYHLGEMWREERSLIYTAARRAGDQALEQRLQRVDAACRARYEEAVRQEAAYQARTAERESSRPAAPAAGFDFQGALEQPSADDATRCASCLGSGKGTYVTGGKAVEVDASGRPTGRTYDPPCAACGGTGFRSVPGR